MLNKMIAWIFVFVWMTVIFYLSHQPATASSELSTGLTEQLVHFLEGIFPFMQYEVNDFTFIVRKFAHLSAYFLLGFLTIRALTVSMEKLNLFVISTAIIIGVCYAISDEVHQLFILGRSGEIRDVLIDSVGVILGIGLYIYIVKLRKNLLHSLD